MIEQFKTITDLQDVITALEGRLARPTRHLSHPTLYRKRDVVSRTKIIKGIQIEEWCFSEDGQWVLPHDQMGLSFSSRFQHLKGVFKMKKIKNPGSTINIYWILERADIPPDMKFEEDRSKKGHYFLTVTRSMTLDALVKKLKMVAHRMSVIRNAERAL